MAFSVKDLAELIQRNQELVTKVHEAVNAGGGALTALADELAARQQQTATILTPDGSGGITVARATSMKDKQDQLLARIAALQKQINELADMPALVGALEVDLSTAFLSLADTYSEAVASIVPLSKADESAIAALIHQAQLDTEQRKRWAAILAGAVSLVEAGLKVALTVAAR